MDEITNELYHLPIGASQEPQKQPRLESLHFFDTNEWAIVSGISLGILFVGVLDIILEWRSGYQVLLFLLLLTAAWWAVFGRLITYVVDIIDSGSIYDDAVRSMYSIVFRGLCIVTITYFGRLGRSSLASSSLSPTDVIIIIITATLLFTDVYFTMQRAGRLSFRERWVLRGW
ncbi:MAG: hypothetical protein AB7P49_00600 [Bdellovibrionales bacterium]